MHVARISACECSPQTHYSPQQYDSPLYNLLKSELSYNYYYYDHIVLIAVAGWAIIWPPHVIWPAEIGWNCCRGAKSKKSNGECHSWLC